MKLLYQVTVCIFVFVMLALNYLFLGFEKAVILALTMILTVAILIYIKDDKK